MRQLILCIILFLCVVSNAQTMEGNKILAGRSIYAEWMGASFISSVNYDSRFNEYSRWGYRVGLAYTFNDMGKISFCCDCDENSDDIRGFNIPLEINYLVGRKNTKSKLDLGAGVNLGYYTKNSGSMFGYFMFMNIGYRFQPSRGITFRIGLSPKFSFDEEVGLIEYVWITSFVPYLSIGYAF